MTKFLVQGASIYLYI